MERPLGIEIYHSTLPEAGRKPGGVETYVDRLADRLVANGHRVTVASFVPAPSAATYEWASLGPPRVGRSRLGRLALAPLLLNRLPRSTCDVIHLHGDDWFFVRRHVPTVRTFHGSALWEARTAETWRRRVSQRLVYPLELLASRLATSAYSVGPGDGLPYRLSGRLDLGIEPSQPPTARSQAPTLLFVGTWRGRKRGAFLHALFQDTVRAAVPNAELWMVSDDCAPGPGITHFKAIEDAQLIDLYQRAWVFCLPSTYEGFGLPYLEAMANGAMVVSSPNPGARYLTREGHVGLLAPDGELADALIKALTNDELRRRYRSRAHRVATEFSWDACVQNHLAAYRDAIARFGAAASASRKRAASKSPAP